MRHIAIISPNPASNTGGVERMCVLLGRVLENQGWRVSIVGPKGPPKRWQFQLGLGYLALSRSATKAARALNPDLIISNGYLGVGISRRTPRVHIYHGTMVGDTRAEGSALPIREHLRRTVAAGVPEAFAAYGGTKLVCVSDAAATEAHRYYRVRADKIIPNGIDTKTFAPRERPCARRRLSLSENGRYALFVGRLEHRKGGDLLMQATQAAGFELMIAGVNSTSGARHLGMLDPDALADAYAAADCVVLPSRYEACSLVVLEALACGRPLLTTRVGWMRTFLQALPEYDALCVKPTIEDISTRLLALADINTKSLTADARAFVLKHNSLERYSEHWRILLKETVDGR